MPGLRPGLGTWSCPNRVHGRSELLSDGTQTGNQVAIMWDIRSLDGGSRGAVGV